MDIEDGLSEVRLPATKGDLALFINKLLGKPSIIERDFSDGYFELTQENFLSLDHIIRDRISQQNDANQVFFEAKIFYDNQSSVSFGSVEEFVTYKETRNIATNAVALTWSFLIKFNDKMDSEKQTIEISAVSSAKNMRGVIDGDSFFKYAFGGPSINLKIMHTARTWGVDMENWLSCEIEKLIMPFPKLHQFVGKHNNPLQWSIFSILVGFTIVVAVLRGFWIRSQLTGQMAVATENGVDSLERLGTLIARGVWPLYIVYSFGFILLSTIVLLAYFLIVPDKFVPRKPRSYLLFTEKSVVDKDKNRKKTSRKVYYFISSVVLDLVANMLNQYCNECQDVSSGAMKVPSSAPACLRRSPITPHPTRARGPNPPPLRVWSPCSSSLSIHIEHTLETPKTRGPTSGRGFGPLALLFRQSVPGAM